MGDGRAGEGVGDWLGAEEEVGGEKDEEGGEEEEGEEGAHAALRQATRETVKQEGSARL